MKINIIKTICTLTLMTFTTSTLFGTEVHYGTLSKVATNLESLSIAHKQGVKSLESELSKNGFDQSQIKSLLVKFIQADEMPKIETRADKLHLSLKSKEIILSFKQADKNIISINGQDLSIDPSQSVDENIQIIAKKIRGWPLRSTTLLDTLFLPTAHADNMNWGTILIIAAVVIAGFYLFNKINTTNEKVKKQGAAILDLQSRQSADHHEIGKLKGEEVPYSED